MKVLSIDVGITNLGYCFLESDSKEILEWKLITVKGSSVDPCKAVKSTLDAEGVPSEPPDVILVERQPGRNKAMLKMEAYIHMYYVARYADARIELYSAVHKLRDTGVENHGRGKGKYAARKKASVALAAAFLKDHPQNEQVVLTFEKTKKKDDLADAFLQALSYADSGNASLAGTAAAATAPARAVMSRKPTERQERTGKYSPSNIKFILKDKLSKSIFMFVETDPVKALRQVVGTDLKLSRSIDRNYASLECCMDALGLREEVEKHLKTP
jgi:hypothetical protein